MATLISSVPQFAGSTSRLSSHFDFQAFVWDSAYAREVLDHLLIVGGCSHTCAACGQLAHPDESRHLTVPSSNGAAGCGTTWLVAATTRDTSWAHTYVAELGMIDAGIVCYDELAEPANLRDSVTLSPATHI